MANPADIAKDLDWNDLRYFLAAARAGTLAGAARALGVEHSTIGRRLTALEQALGVVLLARGPDGLKLTALAERLVARLEDVDRIVRDVAELCASQKARVRLATPSGFSRLISPHLTTFHGEHPDVTIELLGSSRVADLKSGDADLAIRVGGSDDPDVIARKVADVGWSLYATDAYVEKHGRPPDARRLAGHDLLGFEATLATTPGAQWIDEHGQGAHIVMRCREMMDVVAGCVAGVGLAALPCVVSAWEPSLRRLSPDVLGTRPLSIVYRKEARAVEPIRTVIAFVADLLRANAEILAGVIAAPGATH